VNINSQPSTFTPTAHNQSATTITTDTLDGDRLPAISNTKKGGVPMTATPAGKFLKDDGLWFQAFSGLTQISVGVVEPVGPTLGDLWIDTT